MLSCERVRGVCHQIRMCNVELSDETGGVGDVWLLYLDPHMSLLSHLHGNLSKQKQRTVLQN